MYSKIYSFIPWNVFSIWAIEASDSLPLLLSNAGLTLDSFLQCTAAPVHRRRTIFLLVFYEVNHLNHS